jgi:hypothetical protein
MTAIFESLQGVLRMTVENLGSWFPTLAANYASRHGTPIFVLIKRRD